MTKNRKNRRASRAATLAMLRAVHPGARLITWAQLRQREPDMAADVREAVTATGHRVSDVLIYQHSGAYAVMYPVQFPGDQAISADCPGNHRGMVPGSLPQPQNSADFDMGELFNHVIRNERKRS